MYHKKTIIGSIAIVVVVLGVAVMYFVLNNVPTIEVMDAAISEGIMTEKEKGDFVSLEEEAKLKKQTVEQYQQKGVKRGAEKDLRDIWQNSGANYEYDAARRLYYLEIAGEPVMDEFERDYIELLGTNAARYDHAVLEIGFGMGISGNAIQKELVRQGDLALQEGREANPTHIIIEFNHAVAEKAREWAKRQKIPVVVLEGDWKEKIKEINGKKYFYRVVSIRTGKNVLGLKHESFSTIESHWGIFNLEEIPIKDLDVICIIPKPTSYVTQLLS